MRIENLTTVCYIEHRGRILMLHRVKKDQDINAGKWLGVGGHLESGESPHECALREVREETGISLDEERLELRGVISFSLMGKGQGGEPVTECVFVFTVKLSDDTDVKLAACDEGELEWIQVEELESLPVWEGDRIMFGLLQERREFWSLKLTYDAEDRLIEDKLWR